jgi:hypothetical protein
MNAAPVLFRWSGEAMEPLSRFAKACDDVFTVGEVYRMEVQEQRSIVSHNHYFATLQDIFLSLPEGTDERIASAEHLRKFALIRCGYRDERTIVCANKAEARRIAAFIQPMDEFAIVAVTEATVVVWTAKSQSMKAMGKVEFAKSKDDVLGYCQSLLERDAA